MKIFFDEDAGTKVAQALAVLDIATVEYISNRRRIKKGTRDEDWLPIVGRGGFLLLSCNIGILEAEAQRDLLIRENVGVVFLPGQATRLQLLRLVLSKWEWLESIHENAPRPFAYKMTISGRISPVALP